MSALDDIPRETLIEMLKEAVFYCPGGDMYDGKVGYSLEVSHDTAITEICCRDKPLYPTPEEAIIGAWDNIYSPEANERASVELAKLKRRLAETLG